MSSIENHPDFCKVTVRTMNPKSITSGQLYGDFDENTHEWSDGILAIVYRQCSKAKIEDGRQWIVFDGMFTECLITSTTRYNKAHSS